MTTCIIKVYGESCNYYVGPGGRGVMSPSEAIHFDDEQIARTAMYSLRNRAVILSRWEIIRRKDA